MSQPYPPLAADDAVAAEVSAAWADHVGDPAAVVDRLDAMLPRVSPSQIGAWADALVQACGPEHLADSARGLASLDRAAIQLGDDPRALGALQRGRAVLHLHADAPAEAEAMFDALATHRAHHESWALLMAARGAVARGRPVEALAWLDRGAKLAFQIADTDPVLRTIGEVAQEVAQRLVAVRPRDGAERKLLRSASILARVTAERRGTWRDVTRAELLLASASLAVDEPVAAVAHAEIALTICRSNGATPEVLAEAEQVLLAGQSALAAVTP